MTPDNDGSGRQSDLAVMHAHEYKQKRRLQRLLDAQDHVEEIANRAYQQYTAGEIHEDAKNIVLLRAVQQYIRECYNLLLEYDDGLGPGEWNEYLDGPEVTETGQRLGDPLGRIEMRGGDDVVFWGLDGLLNADRFYVDEWTTPAESRHGPDGVEHHEARHTVPESVAWNGYVLLRRFLAAEKDMEVQFEEMDESLPVWGFEEVTEANETDVEVV